MQTLPDYVAPGLDILSVGLNPSPLSVASGIYFANPRNRFWRALGRSGLADVSQPGPGVHDRLLAEHGLGFTDVVKRPTRGAGGLRAADFRRWAPRLLELIVRNRPRYVWFHGKVAYDGFVRHAGGPAAGDSAWGLQARPIGSARVYVSPNPSPANARFSLDDLVVSYTGLARLCRR